MGHGRRWSTYHHWRHQKTKAQDAAGVRRFRFHELRRAAADRLGRSGVSVDVYCRLMGHSEITGLRHYAVVDTDDLRKAHEAGLGAARRRAERPTPSAGTGNVVTVSVAAMMLDVAEADLVKLHEEGQLSAVRFGDQLLVDVGEVRRLRGSPKTT